MAAAHPIDPLPTPADLEVFRRSLPPELQAMPADELAWAFQALALPDEPTGEPVPFDAWDASFDARLDAEWAKHE